MNKHRRDDEEKNEIFFKRRQLRAERKKSGLDELENSLQWHQREAVSMALQ